jgi:uncharacterized membrane protein
MNRIVAIDSIRTFALITLMLCHVVIFLSPPNKNYPEIFFFCDHLIGDFGASIFYFLFGMSLAYVYFSRKEKGVDEQLLVRNSIERGLFIFFCGVLLSFLSLGVDAIPKFDTLHFVGLVTIFLILCRNFPTKFFIIVGSLAVILSPLIRIWTDYTAHWGGAYEITPAMAKISAAFIFDPLSDYKSSFAPIELLKGIIGNAYFPIFPWLFFPCVGFVFGKKMAFKQTEKFIPLALWTAVFSLVASALFVFLGQLQGVNASSNDLATHFFTPYSMYPNTISIVLLQLCVNMLIFSFVWYWDEVRPRNPHNLFRRYGKSISKYSLSIYFYQILILGIIGRTSQYFFNIKTDGESFELMSEPVALVWAFISCGLMYLAAEYFSRVKGRYITMEWYMDKILPSRRLLKKHKEELQLQLTTISQ